MSRGERMEGKIEYKIFENVYNNGQLNDSIIIYSNAGKCKLSPRRCNQLNQCKCSISKSSCSEQLCADALKEKIMFLKSKMVMEIYLHWKFKR